MYPACTSSSTRPSHSLPAGFTPTLSAAPRTTTYGAGFPKICLRICFNIPRALSLTFRTLSSTTASVRSPETLPYPAVRLRPCYQRREVAGCVLVTSFGYCGPIYGSLIICPKTVEQTLTVLLLVLVYPHDQRRLPSLHCHVSDGR